MKDKGDNEEYGSHAVGLKRGLGKETHFILVDVNVTPQVPLRVLPSEGKTTS